MTTEPTSTPEKSGEVPPLEAQTASDNKDLNVVLDLRPHIQRAAPRRLAPTMYMRFIKPTIDRILGTVLCLVSLPFLSVLVIAIWLSMGPPAIYTQRRVGKGGRPFIMYKLRTMQADQRGEQAAFDGRDRRRVHKTPTDPRITKFGRFLRKWSLDETPQFFNVMLGQMSLVGPRPELVEIVETKYDGWQHARHSVKPGITGPWQISEQRQKLMYQATEVDLRYIDHLSLREDLRILALTIPAALGKRRSF
jgi:lipopolysaccharide/colanic/teichoic acid biosynthesis glycosyltransferase